MGLNAKALPWLAGSTDPTDVRAPGWPVGRASRSGCWVAGMVGGFAWRPLAGFLTRRHLLEDHHDLTMVRDRTQVKSAGADVMRP